jgi:hypothetical protein
MTGADGAPTQLTFIGGGVTVTEKASCDWLFDLSLVVQVTSVVPIGNTLPAAGAQVTGVARSTWSIAVKVGYVTAAPSELVACTVTVETGRSTAPCVSATVSVTDPLPTAHAPVN